MALFIDATVGGASANSFGTVAEANAYLDSRTNGGAWAAITDPDVKARLLITATIRLDQETYRGQRSSVIQALAFPRTGLYLDGAALPSDAIPAAVKYAEFEEALAILNSGTTDPFAASGTEGISSVDAGGVKVTFRDPRAATSKDGIPSAADDPSINLSPQAYRLLRGWLLTGLRSQFSKVRLVRS